MEKDWQHSPFTNVLRACGIEQWTNVERSGKVAYQMDPSLGKRVIRITGTIPAVNYIRLPTAKSVQTPGRFCYMQIQVEPSALYSLHLDVGTLDGNTVRVSIGNIVKSEGARKKTGTALFPLLNPPSGWLLLSVNMEAALQGSTTAPFKALKSLQLCANMRVRGVFTSDIKFSPQSLPRDMVLSYLLEPSQISQVWLPCEPLDVPEAPLIRQPRHPGPQQSSTDDVRPSQVSDQQPVQPLRTAASASVKSEGSAVAGARVQRTSDGKGAALQQVISSAAIAQNQREHRQSLCESEGPRAAAAAGPAAASGAIGRAGEALSCKAKAPDEVAAAGGAASGEPAIMQLQHVHGYTGEFTRTVTYVEATEDVVYTSGKLIIAMNVADCTSTSSSSSSNPTATSSSSGIRCTPWPQRFFIGHTAYVCAVALDGSGQLMASAQEGKEGVVRLWDFPSGTCMSILWGHVHHLVCLGLSPDGRQLLVVGQDHQSRQLLVLWGVSEVRQGHKATIINKQTTDYNVRCLKFSPFEKDHLFTAGRDSIRCYRLKEQTLRGMSIRVKSPQGQLKGTAAASMALGPNIFTDIAFEVGNSAQQLRGRTVYVSSAGGSVFQVDYDRRLVVAIYQLHSGAINSISLGEGIAVTGSDDRCLRVWPLDFSCYLLEAGHESPVTSTATGLGGSRVVVGSEDGVLGMLDVVSRQYTTLLRSHTQDVLQVVANPCRPEYCTVSADHTIRIWDNYLHQQLYEFGSAGDPVACVTYHPGGLQLAVGFNSGWMRVFDVATTALLQAVQQHRAAVWQLAYTPDGRLLYSGGLDGLLCVYDVTRAYQPMKLLCAASMSVAAVGRAGPCCVAVSPDGRQLATTTYDEQQGGYCVLLLEPNSQKLQLSMMVGRDSVSRVEFSPDSKELWVLTSDSNLFRFKASDGSLLQQLQQPHPGATCSCFTLIPALGLLATGGSDQVLRLWRYDAQGGGTEVPAAGDYGAQAAEKGEGLVGSVAASGDAGKGASSSSRVTEMAVPKLCQSFVGQQGSIADLAVVQGKLVSVGGGSSICVWDVLQPASPEQHEPEAKGAAGAGGSGKQLCKVHPDLNVTMRSWLDRENDNSAVRGFSPGGGAYLDDTGVTPSGLFQAVPPGPSGMNSAAFTGHSPASAVAAGAGTAMSSSITSSSSTGRCIVPPKMQCSAVWGMSPCTIPHPSVSNPPAKVPTTAAAGDRSPADALIGFPLSPKGKQNSGLDQLATQQQQQDKVVAARAPLLWIRSLGLLAYPADQQLALQDLQTHQQQWMSHHTQPIGATALSQDEQLLATAAAAPEPGRGGVSDVCVWQLSSRRLVRVLRHHTQGIHLLAFSPDGAYLVAVAGSSLCMWGLEEGEPVALGRTLEVVLDMAWLPYQSVPQFLTCGADGLLLWSLQPTFLEQRLLVLPCATATTLTAVCTATADYEQDGGTLGSGAEAAAAAAALAGGAEVAAALAAAVDGRGDGGRVTDPWYRQQQQQRREEAATTAWVADAAGGVWRVCISDGLLQHSSQVFKLLPGERATALTWSQHAAALAVATDQGRVLRYCLSAAAGEREGKSCMASSRGGIQTGGDGGSRMDGGAHPGGAATSSSSSCGQLTAGGAAAAAAAAGAPAATGAPFWGAAGPRGHVTAELLLDGGCAALQLDPEQLQKGVVVSSSATCWFIDLARQQKIPLLWSHAAAVTGMMTGQQQQQQQREPQWPQRGQQQQQQVEERDGVVITTAQDGVLRVWSVGRQQARTLLELASDAPCTIACTLPPTHAPPGPGSRANTRGAALGCLVAGYATGFVRCFDLDERCEVWGSARHPSGLIALIPHPEEKAVMSASRDGLITVSYTSSGSLLSACQDFTGGLTPMHALAPAPSNPSVAAAAWADRLVVFEPPWKPGKAAVRATYTCRQVPDVLPPGITSSLAFIPGSPNLLLFSSPCLGPSVVLFDFTSATLLSTFDHPCNSPVTCIAVAPAGDVFALGCLSGAIGLVPAAAAASASSSSGGAGGCAGEEGGSNSSSRVLGQKLTGPMRPTMALAFVDGGARLVSAAGQLMFMWDRTHPEQ